MSQRGDAAAGWRRRLLLKRAAVGTGALGLAGTRPGAAEVSAAAQQARPPTQPTHAEAVESADNVKDADDERPFWFGFIGDTPYSRLEEGALRMVLDAMANQPLEFVLHVGDIKSSLETCNDDLLRSRLALLDACPHPLILTPGDNEWTDCGPAAVAVGIGRPPRTARLAARECLWPTSVVGRAQDGCWISKVPTSRPRPTAAQPATQVLDRTSSKPPRLPENLRWRVGSLQFCTLHVVGSNNAPRAVAGAR